MNCAIKGFLASDIATRRDETEVRNAEIGSATRDGANVARVTGADADHNRVHACAESAPRIGLTTAWKR